METAPTMSFLYDCRGKRKYLTTEECRAFLAAARGSPPDVFAFCAMLAYTGARISEVLALVSDRIDPNAGLVIIESLKKRKGGVYRAVPVPTWLIDRLDALQNIKLRKTCSDSRSERIWPWCRTTAWKHVKRNMEIVGMEGPHACPRGLRHTFAVSALEAEVPLNMLRKWLGHSRLSTTAIYADATGREERTLANRLWNTYAGGEEGRSE